MTVNRGLVIWPPVSALALIDTPFCTALHNNNAHADPSRVALFHGVEGKAYGVFLNLAMDKKDKYIQNKAVKILSALCVTGM